MASTGDLRRVIAAAQKGDIGDGGSEESSSSSSPVQLQHGEKQTEKRRQARSLPPSSGSSKLLESVAFRRRVLRVVFVSLILDLLSFTFILPLLPKLLEFYRNVDLHSQASSSSSTPTILFRILSGINSYKNAFAKPINDRYDIVLLGGAIGSLFSFCQTIASPLIGLLSDRYGRRQALLWSMCGNILSVTLWVAATDFNTFLASRVIGGLSEGNVQMAMAIATDVSDEKQRSSTMAIIGVCFSIAFTFGPALGAALSKWSVVAANPFATAAGVSLGLILVETLYLYFCLPETLKREGSSEEVDLDDQHPLIANPKKAKSGSTVSSTSASAVSSRRVGNSKLALHIIHFLFILCFSGMEFSLPFMTYDLFSFDSAGNGRLLGVVGIIASIFQGTITRRLAPLRLVQIGTVSCALAFFILSRLSTVRELYTAAALLAVTSGTVVTGLNALSSLEARKANERGRVLGNHRSWGQLGRALGPVLFCSLYWWAGRTRAYQIGGMGMMGVVTLVLGLLRMPSL